MIGDDLRDQAKAALDTLDADPATGLLAGATVATAVLASATDRGTWVVGPAVRSRDGQVDEVWHLPTQTLLARCVFAGDARLIAAMSTKLLTLLASQWETVAHRMVALGIPTEEQINAVAQCREFLTGLRRALGGPDEH